MSPAVQSRPVSPGVRSRPVSPVEAKRGPPTAAVLSALLAAASASEDEDEEDEDEEEDDNYDRMGASMMSPTPVRDGNMPKPFFAAHERLSHVSTAVPLLVRRCCEYLSARGLDEEGIFRVNGSASRMSALKKLFEEGNDVDLTDCFDVNLIAGVLKLFFREQRETTVDSQCLKKLGAIFSAKEKLGPDGVLAQLRDAVRAMPRGRFETVRHVASLCVLVAERSEENLMPISNIALAWGPTMFRDLSISSSAFVMTRMLEDFDAIFIK